jgi:hypothetical protein
MSKTNYKQTQFVSNLDLYNNKFKYDIEILEQNVDHLDNKYLLYTQNLTADFCVKYLYNPDINLGDEDSYLFDMSYILAQQKHISKMEFMNALNKLLKN